MAIEQSIKILSKRKVVLADGETRSRGEMGRYLRSVGMEVVEAGAVPEALDLWRAQMPALLVCDLDLPGDIVRLLCLAGEPRAGLVTRLLLTCRARTPKVRLLSVLNAVLQGSSSRPPSQGAGAIPSALAGIIVTPCRPEVMIDRLAQALDQPSDADHAEAETLAISDPPVSLVAGNNSLLLQRVLCPFHERETRVRRYALRTGRIEANADFFDVPSYDRAVGGADYVNYHQLCVTVCPDCHFASADPAHFAMPHDKTHVVRPLTPSAKYAIVSRAHQRKDILGDVDPDEFYSERRTPSGAVKSLELALHCSESLHRVAKHLFTDELVRQGNYHLRIAHLQALSGDHGADRDRHIERAARLLKEAFPTLPETGIPRSVYQVVATSIYLGEDRDAHQYLSQLAKLSQRTTDPTVKAAMERYLFRSARAWENRDEHRRAPVVDPAGADIMAPFAFKAA